MDQILEKFQFKGFEPDPGLRESACETLDIILGSAPSDAEPVAQLERTREGFEGSLRLNSQQGVFEADVVGHDVRETMERLTEKIFEQIGRWRRSRQATLGEEPRSA